MKTTDFARYLNKYLARYLPDDQGSTPQTIDSYRYSFILFLKYIEETQRIPADKLKICDLTYKNVIGFLNWLQEKRGNGISTRNQRQAAINGFIHFLKYEYPDYMDEYQKILSIPFKRIPQKEVSYLKKDGVKLLINQVDLNSTNGLRDFVMLLLMYTTGIRVSELIQIRVKDLSLTEPCTLLVHGKGQKSRYVPLLKTSIPNIRKYLISKGLDKPEKVQEYLFRNHMKEPFTRQGVNYIISKYANKARSVDSSLVPDDFSPHKMRHTTAMELVEAGVDLIYIRDLLGHVSVVTTEVYAKANAAHQRQAIESASKELVPPEDAEWDNNQNLKEWLKSFNR
ncbi:MAG: tyrosine-type recombinase/integrase [Clostridia bacterium]|nr:tyrosine-type recombinase/integrase [Clostridia bacterium]